MKSIDENSLASSDYLRNLKASIEQDGGLIAHNHLGIAVSAFTAKGRADLVKERERRRIEQAARSSHVGVVGQRDEFDVRVTKYIDQGHNDFGDMKTLISFEDDDGNVLVTRTTGRFRNAVSIGDEVRIKATVDSHTDYQGIAQTNVKRATLLSE